MKKKALVILTSLTLALCSVLTACSGINYDFQNSDLTPYITLPEDLLTRDYKAGLTLEAEPTDEDIDAEIKEVMEKNFSEPVDLDETAAVEDGDKVTIDYKGILDGETEPFEGGSATDYALTINLESPTFIDGFEAGLIGWTVGTTKTLNLTFPAPYENNTELSGKAVNFEVTLDKIERTEVKELTDTLVAEHPDIFDDHSEGITTVAAYREHVKEHLMEDIETANNKKIINAIYKYVSENSSFSGTYPDGLLDKYIKKYLDYYEHTEAAGMTETVNGQQVSTPKSLKEYVKLQGYASVDAFKEAVVVPEAETALKNNLVLYACAQKAGISITDKQAEDEAREQYKSIKDMYTQLGLTDLSSYGLSTFDSYLSNYGGLDMYKQSLTFDRTFEKIAGITPTEE